MALYLQFGVDGIEKAVNGSHLGTLTSHKWKQFSICQWRKNKFDFTLYEVELANEKFKTERPCQNVH